MTAVSLSIGAMLGFTLSTGKTVHVHAKHYKHNMDPRHWVYVHGHGSVTLSLSRKAVMRIGLQQYNSPLILSS